MGPKKIHTRRGVGIPDPPGRCRSSVAFVPHESWGGSGTDRRGAGRAAVLSLSRHRGGDAVIPGPGGGALGGNHHVHGRIPAGAHSASPPGFYPLGEKIEV